MDNPVHEKQKHPSGVGWHTSIQLPQSKEKKVLNEKEKKKNLQGYKRYQRSSLHPDREVHDNIYIYKDKRYKIFLYFTLLRKIMKI